MISLPCREHEKCDKGSNRSSSSSSNGGTFVTYLFPSRTGCTTAASNSNDHEERRFQQCEIVLEAGGSRPFFLCCRYQVRRDSSSSSGRRTTTTTTTTTTTAAATATAATEAESFLQSLSLYTRPKDNYDDDHHQQQQELQQTLANLRQQFQQLLFTPAASSPKVGHQSQLPSLQPLLSVILDVCVPSCLPLQGIVLRGAHLDDRISDQLADALFPTTCSPIKQQQQGRRGLRLHLDHCSIPASFYFCAALKRRAMAPTPLQTRAPRTNSSLLQPPPQQQLQLQSRPQAVFSEIVIHRLIVGTATAGGGGVAGGGVAATDTPSSASSSSSLQDLWDLCSSAVDLERLVLSHWVFAGRVHALPSTGLVASTVAQVVRTCPHLRSLDLSGITLFPAATVPPEQQRQQPPQVQDFFAALAQLPGLQELILQETKLPLHALPAMVRYLEQPSAKKLKRLDLTLDPLDLREQEPLPTTLFHGNSNGASADSPVVLRQRDPLIHAIVKLPCLQELKLELLDWTLGRVKSSGSTILASLLEGFVERQHQQQNCRLGRCQLYPSTTPTLRRLTFSYDIQSQQVLPIFPLFLPINLSTRIHSGWLQYLPHLQGVQELSVNVSPRDPQWPQLVAALRQNIHLTRGQWGAGGGRVEEQEEEGHDEFTPAPVQAVYRRNRRLAQIQSRGLQAVSATSHWTVLVQAVAASSYGGDGQDKEDATPLYLFLSYNLDAIVSAAAATE